jgi:cytochrome c peroxidase
VGLGAWIVRKGSFEPELEDDWRFKTPSLLYVGGTPPYYHDGSSSTLEELIERNGNRMGHTKQLSNGDRAALIAFLRTL